MAGPKCDRQLFRQVRKKPPLRIVEFGVGDLSRTAKLIALAGRYRQELIHYCGIDLFDMRPDGQPQLDLKDAHRRLSRTGAKIRLVPGTLSSAVPRTANVLTGTDLLVVDVNHSRDSFDCFRHFLPRMLHSRTTIARFAVVNNEQHLSLSGPESFSQGTRTAA